MKHKKVLMLASVASMIDQFNLPNIRLLLEMGCEVHVACNYREGNTCDSIQIRRLQERLRDMHVIQHQWDCPRNIVSLKQCCMAYRQLWRLTGRYQFDWLHCHSPVGGALARLAAHWRGIRVIYTAHGFHFYKGAPLRNWVFYYPAEKLLAHWTDVLITVNKEDYCLAVKSLRAGKVFYIPGVGIDTGHFYKAALEKTGADGEGREKFCRKFHIPQDAAILLSVGELSRRKNHQDVIAALAGLQEEHVYYLISGQGALKHALMEQAEKLGVATYVRLPGFLENVEELYRNADLFVFPSLQEGMPVALMEAMAAGLPCVASDIRGNRELIDSQGGRLFLPGQTAEIQDALREFLNCPRFRDMCGCHNQEKIKNYDLAVVGRRMKKIYGKFIRTAGAGNKNAVRPGIDVNI